MAKSLNTRFRRIEHKLHAIQVQKLIEKEGGFNISQEDTSLLSLPSKNKVTPKAFVEDHLKAHKSLSSSVSLSEEVISEIATEKKDKAYPAHLRIRQKTREQQKVGTIIHNQYNNYIQVLGSHGVNIRSTPKWIKLFNL